MPPNAPSGWNLPQWLQVVLIFGVILTPFAKEILTWLLHGRRTTAVAEKTADTQQQLGFMDRILKSAETAPALLDRVDKLLEVNDELRARDAQREKEHQADIQRLQLEIDDLRRQLSMLETDRDKWRDQAAEVPNLKGQIKTYEKVVRDHTTCIDELRAERDELKRRVAELEAIVAQ